MNSRNQKQEELIRRLDDIRRQRTAMQPETPVEQQSRRNERTGELTRRKRNNQPKPTTQQKRQTSSDRNRNTQRTPVSVDDPGRHSQEMRIREHQSSVELYEEARRMRQAKIHEKVQAREKKVSSSKTKSNTLIDKLSNKDSLRQAIILNEVLSKPIALRRHSR